jgi:phytoene desaturase (3,4-didehydrolycopene-forming)
MRRFAGNQRIAALLSFQDLYVGLSPYAAPGVFSLLAATEITDGVW